jgi:hypothetical protein
VAKAVVMARQPSPRRSESETLRPMARVERLVDDFDILDRKILMVEHLAWSLSVDQPSRPEARHDFGQTRVCNGEAPLAAPEPAANTKALAASTLSRRVGYFECRPANEPLSMGISAAVFPLGTLCKYA